MEERRRPDNCKIQIQEDGSEDDGKGIEVRVKEIASLRPWISSTSTRFQATNLRKESPPPDEIEKKGNRL